MNLSKPEVAFSCISKWREQLEIFDFVGEIDETWHMSLGEWWKRSETRQFKAKFLPRLSFIVMSRPAKERHLLK